MLCKVLASSWPISMMLPNKVLMCELCVLQDFEMKSECMIVEIQKNCGEFKWACCTLANKCKMFEVCNYCSSRMCFEVHTWYKWLVPQRWRNRNVYTRFWSQRILATRAMCKRDWFVLQEGCARFCCLLEICPKLCKRDSFKRVVQEFFLPERCQKLCKRDSFKRVLQECFFLPERCQKLCKRNSFKRVVQEWFFSVREMSRVAQDLMLSWSWRKREIHIFLFHLNILENCWTMFLKHLLHISLNYLLNVSEVSLKFLLISFQVSLKFLLSFSQV